MHYLEKVSLIEYNKQIFYRAPIVLSTVSSLKHPSPLSEKFSDSSLNYFFYLGGIMSLSCGGNVSYAANPRAWYR